MRLLFVALLVIHGVIHLFGFAKAFELAEIPQLTMAPSHTMGLLWLGAAVLLFAAAALRYLAPRWFWVVGGLAVVVSQALIVTAWGDAKAGTAANVVVLIGVALAFAAYGPGSLRADYRADVRASRMAGATRRIVEEADLHDLPAPVQRYLRITNAVGQPQIANFKAVWHGRIRASATEPWMTFHAEQHNFFGAQPARLFLMDATMKHVPVAILHRFVGDAATFQVRLLSARTMVDAAGPEMNRSETVTLFNDLCLLAPGRLIDPSVRWEAIDASHARAHYTRGTETISAVLVFDPAGELADFISDDRSAASADGKAFTPQRWRTPVRDYKSFGTRRASSFGEAHWMAASGEFAYGEFALDRLEYNV